MPRYEADIAVYGGNIETVIVDAPNESEARDCAVNTIVGNGQVRRIEQIEVDE